MVGTKDEVFQSLEKTLETVVMSDGRSMNQRWSNHGGALAFSQSTMVQNNQEYKLK